MSTPRKPDHPCTRCRSVTVPARRELCDGCREVRAKASRVARGRRDRERNGGRRRVYYQSYRIANAAAIQQKNATYRAANRERLNAASVAWYWANRDAILARRAERRMPFEIDRFDADHVGCLANSDADPLVVLLAELAEEDRESLYAQARAILAAMPEGERRALLRSAGLESEFPTKQEQTAC